MVETNTEAEVALLQLLPFFSRATLPKRCKSRTNGRPVLCPYKAALMRHLRSFDDLLCCYCLHMTRHSEGSHRTEGVTGRKVSKNWLKTWRHAQRKSYAVSERPTKRLTCPLSKAKSMADRKQVKRWELWLQVWGPVSRRETGEHETLTETGIDER